MPALNAFLFRSLLGSFDKAGAVREKREEQKSSPLSKLKVETNSEAWTSGFQRPNVWTSSSPPSRTVPQIGRASLPFPAWLSKTNSTKVGSGLPGLYYCTPCSEAINDIGNYHRRIHELFLTGLECSLCEGRKYVANFSAAQRRNPDDASRVCIAHEGRWKLCSHLSFGWKDVTRRDWSRDPGYRETEHGWTVTLTCCHPQHHRKERPALDITHTRIDNGKFLVNATLRQDFFPRVRNLEDQIDACVSKIYGVLDAELAVLCPHLRASPGRIRAFGVHETSGDKMEYTCHCACCELDFRFLLADGIERRQPQISCRREDYVLDRRGEWWSRGVAPETYGLFSDEQTKNILWCDDRQCATSFELASCFASYSWLPVNSRYARGTSREEEIRRPGWRRRLRLLAPIGLKGKCTREESL